MDAAASEELVPVMVDQLGSEMSAMAPAYVEMLCDPQGRVWLQHFSMDYDWMARGPAMDVFGRRGILVADMLLPSGFRPVRFEGDTLLGVLRDEMGLETAARVVIGAPAPGPP